MWKQIGIIPVICFSLISCAKPPLESTPYLYLARGDQLLGQGKLEAAIEEYEKAINEAPHLADAYNSLGHLYQRELKDSRKAIQTYSEGLSKVPNDYSLNLNIMYAHFDLGNIDKGVEHYQLLAKLKLEKQHYSFPREIVEDMTRDMEEEEVLHLCNKYLSMNPTDTMLREKLVGIYKRRKEYDKAKRELDILLKYGGEEGSIYFDLGTCHYNLGHLQEALEYFLKAKQSGLSVPEVVFEKVKRELKEQSGKE